MSNANFSADLLEMMKNGATAEDLAAQLAQALNDAETAYEKEQEEQLLKELKEAAAKAETAKATARKKFATTYMAALREYLETIGEDTAVLDEEGTTEAVEEALELTEGLFGSFFALADNPTPKCACEKNFESKKEKNNTRNFIKSDRDKITDFLNCLFS